MNLAMSAAESAPSGCSSEAGREAEESRSLMMALVGGPWSG